MPFLKKKSEKRETFKTETESETKSLQIFDFKFSLSNKKAEEKMEKEMTTNKKQNTQKERAKRSYQYPGHKSRQWP